MLTKTTTSSFSRPGTLRPSGMSRLPPARPLGGEPPEPAAQIRVPDVAGAVDGDAERTGVALRERELGDHTVTEATQPLTTQLGEPHRTVERDGQGRQPGRPGGHGELGELAFGEAADLVRLHLEEPHGAVGGNGDIAELGCPRRRLEVLAPLLDALDAVLPEDADGVGEVYGEPHGAVGPHGDGGGDIPVALHPVLGEAAPDPERVEPERGSDEASAQDADGDQVASANPREAHPRPSGEGVARVRWSRS